MNSFDKNPTSERAQVAPGNARLQSRGGSGAYRAGQFRGDVPMFSGFHESANPENYGNVHNT
eukprot:14589804-Alexandrium_andersonii.AAC.1